MAYMTNEWLVGYVLFAVWCWGWIATITHVSAEAAGLHKFVLILLLFFIWPYIAYRLYMDGDH